jgi:hypothetical protein
MLSQAPVQLGLDRPLTPGERPETKSPRETMSLVIRTPGSKHPSTNLRPNAKAGVLTPANCLNPLMNLLMKISITSRH